MTWDGDVFAVAKVLTEGSKVHRDNRKVVRLLRGAVEAKLTGPRSGRLYTTYFFTRSDGVVVPYGSRPPHQASAPGEAPAMDTGDLLRSMEVEGRREPRGASITIACTSGYGSYLEYGTSKMRPRPFMRPLINENKVTIKRIYRDGIVDRERYKARALGGRG